MRATLTVKDPAKPPKLSGSAISQLTDRAMQLITPHDAQVLSVLFRASRKANRHAKLASLYIIDAVAREAKKRAAKSGGSTSNATADDNGTEASFMAKLEGVINKIVLDCWENGVPEHRVSREHQGLTRLLTLITQCYPGKDPQGA